MRRLPILLAVSSLCLVACDPSGGGVNSASARVCDGAGLAFATADTIRTTLAAHGYTSAKVESLVPLIQLGKVLVDSACALRTPH